MGVQNKTTLDLIKWSKNNNLLQWEMLCTNALVYVKSDKSVKNVMLSIGLTWSVPICVMISPYDSLAINKQLNVDLKGKDTKNWTWLGLGFQLPSHMTHHRLPTYKHMAMLQKFKTRFD